MIDKVSMIINTTQTLRQAFKAACAQNGTSMNNAINEMMRLFIAGKIHIPDTK